MRHIFIAFILSFISAPVWAGDPAAENLFGRDPGNSAAYACFSTTFDDAWLKDHPGQNVAGMTVFVARRPGEDTVWHSGNIELHFKDSKATYHVAADCSGEGMVLGCGINCDGGGYQMTAISKSELGIGIDGYLRYHDTSDKPTDAETAGFSEGDKNFVLHRTELRDCLPLIADDEIKARIAKGELTQ